MTRSETDRPLASRPGRARVSRTTVLDWVGTLARLVLGGVLLAAGLAKVADPVGSVTRGPRVRAAAGEHGAARRLRPAVPRDRPRAAAARRLRDAGRGDRRRPAHARVRDRHRRRRGRAGCRSTAGASAAAGRSTPPTSTTCGRCCATPGSCCSPATRLATADSAVGRPPTAARIDQTVDRPGGIVVASRVNREAGAAPAGSRGGRAGRAASAVGAATPIVVALVVLALVVVGGIWWQVQRVGGRRGRRPRSAGALGAARRRRSRSATPTAPVVDIYLDFLCSHCAELEERIGDAIADMAVDGEARFVIHPITLLDPTESARSAAAFGCAAGSDVGARLPAGAVRRTPAAGSPPIGWWRSARRSGSTDAAFVQCVEDESEADWAAAVDAAATERGRRRRHLRSSSTAP